jgi:hypothetical protein
MEPNGLRTLLTGRGLLESPRVVTWYSLLLSSVGFCDTEPLRQFR